MSETELPENDYAKQIAAELGLRVQQVRAALNLLNEGNTIPFIARYRKEMTGELDENQLRQIASLHETQKNVDARKQDVLRLLAEHGVFEDEALAAKLRSAIHQAGTLTEVEDIYRPYRPKRKTRATVARERGLAPLADWLQQEEQATASEAQVQAEAARFVSEEKGVSSSDEALQGALDIIAEAVADDVQSRQQVRSLTSALGKLRSTATSDDAESVYEMYYDYAKPLGKLPPHRILAMNRGEREGFLRVSVDVPEAPIVDALVDVHVPKRIRTTDSYVTQLLEDAVRDAYKRLLKPAVERELRSQLTERAETHAIHIFAENLRQLLMQPPLTGRVVLGVDPAYRTGCKLAVVDDTGKLLAISVIYPTPPVNKIAEARQEVLRLIHQFGVTLIAIGNGTASRETEAFIAECIQAVQADGGLTIPYMMVSEAGASVYSASELAGTEFPDLDVSERSAISIARRVQDPLAELVKIDPKAIGVGQYQHDVSQKELGQQLAAVVESVVNQVGVDLNTASPSLLSYIAGLNATVSRNIVQYREAHGRFRSRADLAKVPRLGQKTLEQCAGFLRISGGDELLDATPIHPESYAVVDRLLARIGERKAALTESPSRKAVVAKLQSADISRLSEELSVGIPTLRDIVSALERPNRDPREDVAPPILRTDVLKLEDLEVGMELTGTVRNVVDFGAFVDIGVKNDGLVHISQLADRFVKHPLDVVAVGDIVRVRVIQIDLNKQRVGLSMKGLSTVE